MAGVLKTRDTDGTVRTVTALKVRDADGTVRTLSFARVRDTDGTVREVFTAGGGGGGANPTSISPASRYLSGRQFARSATFVASSTGTAATSYSWGLLDGNGSVATGGDQATATLQVYADAGEFTTSTFYCDMLVGTETFRATCQFDYLNTSSSGTGTLDPTVNQQ